MLSSDTGQASQTRRPATRIPTVCVVDPQADDYQGWDSLARANGLQFQIVASTEEALRLSRSQTVDLWVVNTELPGLSGYELCNMLKDRRPGQAVFLVANEYMPEAERQALRNRATLFGCKGGHLAWLNDWLRNRSLSAANI